MSLEPLDALLVLLFDDGDFEIIYSIGNGIELECYIPIHSLKLSVQLSYVLLHVIYFCIETLLHSIKSLFRIIAESLEVIEDGLESDAVTHTCESGIIYVMN
jgi:hypothetical protein